MSEIQKTGTIAFKITHADADWVTNNHEYKFGPFGHGTLDISAIKKRDRALEVRVGFEHFGHTFSGPLPPLRDGGVSVAIVWDEKSIGLWLNGQRVSSVPFSPTKH